MFKYLIKYLFNDHYDYVMTIMILTFLKNQNHPT
jgi:hypothetical protein